MSNDNPNLPLPGLEPVTVIEKALALFPLMGNPELSEWEQQFLDSIEYKMKDKTGKFKGYELSRKQEAVIEKLYKKLIEDAK